MSYTRPTNTDFKAQFTRDFPYGTSSDVVMDSDIDLAISQANLSINDELFQDQSSFTLLFNFLAAHYLVTNIKASSQGINGNFSWLESSKSVGSVSQSFAIPQKILDHPTLGLLSKTYYGAYYLSYVLPRIVGNVLIVDGGTTA